MKKSFFVKKYLFTLFVVGVLCMSAVAVNDKIQERDNEKQLNRLLESITYEPEKCSMEMELLEQVEPLLENADDRSQARFYQAFAKLHILRGDMDNALLYIMNAQFHAKIAKAYDITAWLSADAAQVYINSDANEIALDCVKQALEYGENQEMEDDFYKHCYLLKSELEAFIGEEMDKARGSYANSLRYAETEHQFFRQDSFQQREYLVLACLKMQEKKVEEAKKYLTKIEDYIGELDTMPTDAVWFSAFYFPYLTLETKCSLYFGEYEKAEHYMEETFAIGTLYGKISSLMIFLNEIWSYTEEINLQGNAHFSEEKIKDRVKLLIVEYPQVFQNKTNVTASHIYESHETSLDILMQKYEKECLYKRIAYAAIAVFIVFAFLLLIICQSERKGRIDSLTETYNRCYFNKVYERLQNQNTEFGVIMYDIDLFKRINDGFGHDVGDLVLKKTAHTVKEFLDKDSVLFRYGGDEFCIICRRKSLEDMARLAERIRSEVDKTEWKDGMKVSFSMGAAVASRSPERDVMAMADKMLYASKEAGRNQVSW